MIGSPENQDRSVSYRHCGVHLKAAEDAAQFPGYRLAVRRRAVRHVRAGEGKTREPFRADAMLVRPRERLNGRAAEESRHVGSVFVRDERRPFRSAELGEDPIELDVQRIAAHAVVPDQRHSSVRREDAQALGTGPLHFEPMKRLGGRDEIDGSGVEWDRLGTALDAAIAGERGAMEIAGRAHRGIGLDGNGPMAARQQASRQKACARSDIRNRGAVRQSAILRQRIEQRVRIVGPRRNVVGNLGSEDRAHAALGLVERPQRRTRILVLDHVRAASRRSRRSARYRMIVATSTRMPQSPTWPSGRSR